MKYLYSRWTESSSTDEQRLEELTKLFNYLVLQSSGDVNEAMQWLRQLAEEYGIFDEKMTMDELIEKLKEMGLIQEVNGNFEMTTKGVQKIRQDALKEIFSSLKKNPFGNHETPNTGKGVERLSETKKWSFGDRSTDIDLTSTMTNALKRDGIDDFTLREDDLEVYETENLSSCATVLMIDISHSMILYGEDRITPAKQVALAPCRNSSKRNSRRTSSRALRSVMMPV
jgi:Ca-activated chloride channel family protein